MSRDEVDRKEPLIQEELTRHSQTGVASYSTSTVIQEHSTMPTLTATSSYLGNSFRNLARLGDLVCKCNFGIDKK